jgi:uncharacterized RDD family membrane protein YckC
MSQPPDERPPGTGESPESPPPAERGDPPIHPPPPGQGAQPRGQNQGDRPIYPPPPGQGDPPPQSPQQTPGAPYQPAPQQPPPTHPIPQGDLPTYRTRPSGPRASFGRRLVALILDGLVVGIPLALVIGLLAALLLGDVRTQPDGTVVEGTGEIVAFSIITTLLSITIWVLYFTLMEGSASGQTVGKRAMGIRVIRFDTGGPLGYPRALGRNLARLLSAWIFYLGYFWMLWDPERQTWHDKISTTVVVPTDVYPVQPRSDYLKPTSTAG